MENSLTFSLDLLANASPAAATVNADGWHMIARVGEWRGHPQGPYTLTPAHLRSMADYFQRHYVANSAELVVDFEHQSLYPPQLAPAAGWIDQVDLREDAHELWAHLRWNSAARELLQNRQYRYLSPAFRFNRPDRVTGKPVLVYLDSVALTNKPFLTELPAVANASDSAAGGSQVAQEEGRASAPEEGRASAPGKESQDA